MGGNLSIASVSSGEDEDEFPMHVVSRFRVRAGAERTLAQTVRSVVERTRGVDGCRFVAMLQETEDAASFAVVEVFATYDSLRAHARGPLVSEFEAAVLPVLDGELKRDVYLPMAEQNRLSYAASVFGGAKHSSDSLFVLTDFDARDVAAATECKTSIEDTRLVAESRQEKGILYFTVAQHMEDKRRFTIVEEYKDLKAFDAHTDAAHLAAAIAALHPHLVEKPRHTTYQRTL